MNADPAYELYGYEAIGDLGKPHLEKALWVEKRSFHVRYGNHDMNEYDWGVYIEAAKREFGD